MNNLFTIEKLSAADGNATYSVTLDSKHRVFDGHFPGNPILPGVMSMFIIRTCAENLLGLPKTYFGNVKEIKYLQTIIPDGRQLTVNIECADKVVSGNISNADGEMMMKMKGTLA